MDSQGKPAWLAGGALRLDRVIGQGGMARVWAGEHVASRHPIAVKVLTRHSPDGRLRRAFLAEARGMVRLDHPHILRIFDLDELTLTESQLLGVPDRAPFLVTELAEGALDPLAVRDWNQVRDILEHALLGLAHAHGRALIHRDIKPANLLLDAEGVKLADFGIAWSVVDGTGHARVGTPSYMAPEQIRGEFRDQGPWTDLYALGITAWELVCGLRPFGGDVARVVRAQLQEPPPDLRPRMAVPGPLGDWLARLLAKAPEQRFPTAASALDALRGLGHRMVESPIAVPNLRPSSDTRPTLLLEVLEEEGALEPVQARPRPARPAVPSNPPPQLSSLVMIRGLGVGLVGLRELDLVGQQATQVRVWSSLHAVATTGTTRIVQIDGPVGGPSPGLAGWLTRAAHEFAGLVLIDPAVGRDPRDSSLLAELLRALFRTANLDDAALVQRVERALQGLGWHDPVASLGLSALQGAQVQLGQILDPPTQARLLAELFQRLGGVVIPVGTRVREAQEWLQRLVEMDVPLLVVGHGAADGLPEHPCWVREEVERLPEGALARLLDEIVGIDPPLAWQVEARCGAMPSLALERVERWIRSGMMEPGPGGMTLEASTTQAEIEAALGAHRAPYVDALNAAEFRGLALAACLGDAFDEGEWARSCAALGVPLPEAAREELEARGWLVRERWSELTRFQEPGLAEALLDRARREGLYPEIHAVCAGLLDATAEPGRFARHALESGQLAHALPPLLRAAQVATNAGTPHAALALLDIPNEDELPVALKLDLLRTRSSAHSNCGQRQASMAACEQGLALADPAIHSHWLHFACLKGRELGRMSKWNEREDWFRSLLPHPIDAIDYALRVELAYGLTMAGKRQAAQEIVSDLEARPTEERPWQLDWIAAQIGLYARDHAGALAALERPLDVGIHNRSMWLVMKGICHFRMGHLDEAERLFTAGWQAAESYGNALGAGSVLQQIGDLYRKRGDRIRAVQAYRAAARRHRVLHHSGEGVARLNLGLMLIEEGRQAEAREHALRGLEILTEAGRTGLIAASHTVLLACEPDGLAWQRSLDEVGRIVGETGFWDPDMGTALDLAQGWVAEMGWADRVESLGGLMAEVR